MPLEHQRFFSVPESLAQELEHVNLETKAYVLANRATLTRYSALYADALIVSLLISHYHCTVHTKLFFIFQFFLQIMLCIGYTLFTLTHLTAEQEVLECVEEMSAPGGSAAEERRNVLANAAEQRRYVLFM